MSVCLLFGRVVFAHAQRSISNRYTVLFGSCDLRYEKHVRKGAERQENVGILHFLLSVESCMHTDGHSIDEKGARM